MSDSEGEFKKRIIALRKIREKEDGEPEFYGSYNDGLRDAEQMIEDAKKALYLAMQKGTLEEEVVRWFGT